MNKVFSPPKYLRGKNAIEEVGAVSKELGKRAVIIGGKTALEKVEKRVAASLENSDIQVLGSLWYGGECSWDNINQLTNRVKELQADLVVSIGGGKSMDTGKAVAYKIGVPVVTIPTIAATCAPVTPISIIHTPEGHFQEVTKECALPYAIFADTEIIAAGPNRLLFAGMGDTLAKWYELRATTSRIPKTSWTIAAVSLARACYDVIVEFGGQAKIAVENNEATKELEQVVDAIIWHAGMSSILGGEECRGTAAHAIYYGFTNIEEAHKRFHGELVGYGNLCLLELEGRPEEEIIEEIKLAIAVGVPVTLDEIGKLTDEDVELVAKVAVDTNEMSYMPIKVDEAMTIKAIYAVNEKGKKILAQ